MYGGSGSGGVGGVGGGGFERWWNIITPIPSAIFSRSQPILVVALQFRWGPTYILKPQFNELKITLLFSLFSLCAGLAVDHFFHPFISPIYYFTRFFLQPWSPFEEELKHESAPHRSLDWLSTKRATIGWQADWDFTISAAWFLNTSLLCALYLNENA